MAVELTTLADGGQSALDVAGEVAEWNETPGVVLVPRSFGVDGRVKVQAGIQFLDVAGEGSSGPRVAHCVSAHKSVSGAMILTQDQRLSLKWRVTS